MGWTSPVLRVSNKIRFGFARVSTQHPEGYINSVNRGAVLFLQSTLLLFLESNKTTPKCGMEWKKPVLKKFETENERQTVCDYDQGHYSLVNFLSKNLMPKNANYAGHAEKNGDQVSMMSGECSRGLASYINIHLPPLTGVSRISASLL